MEAFSTSLAICAHKGQWRGALMFYWICAWTNGWVNNGEAGHLRRHRAHYDVTVMMITNSHVVKLWTELSRPGIMKVKTCCCKILQGDQFRIRNYPITKNTLCNFMLKSMEMYCLAISYSTFSECVQDALRKCSAGSPGCILLPTFDVVWISVGDATLESFMVDLQPTCLVRSCSNLGNSLGIFYKHHYEWNDLVSYVLPEQFLSNAGHSFLDVSIAEYLV